jgi:hypothetical protein
LPDAIDSDTDFIDLRFFAFVDKTMKPGDRFEWPSLEAWQARLPNNDRRLTDVNMIIRVTLESSSLSRFVALHSGDGWQAQSRTPPNLLNPVEKSPAPTPLYLTDTLRENPGSVDCYAVSFK